VSIKEKIEKALIKIEEIYEEHIEDYIEGPKRKLTNAKDFVVYDIPQGITSICKWIPTLWKDRNWDQYFIFTILKKKLELTEPVLRNGHCVDGNKRADEVHLCINLIDRILKDDYHENAFKNHDKKWGELDFSFRKHTDGKHCILDMTRQNIKTEKDKELERQESNRLYKHASNMQKQDIEYLFKIMSKHILGWWD
jgi:hypothetical protein